MTTSHQYTLALAAPESPLRPPLVLDAQGEVVAEGIAATAGVGDARLEVLVHRANLVVTVLETAQMLATTLADRDDHVPKYLDRIAAEGKALLKCIEETTGFRPWNAPSKFGQSSGGSPFRTVPDGAVSRVQLRISAAAVRPIDAGLVNRVLGEHYTNDPAAAVKAQAAITAVLAEIGFKPEPGVSSNASAQRELIGDDESPTP